MNATKPGSLGSLEPVSYVLPAYWASYLINGDASGLDDAERAACDAWHKARNLPSPVSCGDEGRNADTGESGEPWFARSNDAGTLAGDVIDFVYLLPRAPEGDGLPDDGDPQDPRTHSLASREAHAAGNDDLPRMDSAEDLA